VSTAVTPVFAERLLKYVRTSGYLILGLAAAFPLLEVGAALWPAHLESATWRFGAAGLVSNYAMGASIELFLLVVLALFANQRRVLLTLGTIAAIIAVLMLGGALMFVLDAIQTRAKVTPAALNRFDITVVGALGKMVLFSLANGLLARGAFRGASGERVGGRARSAVAPIVVSQPNNR
jgi:FlaA1/EpsC-like NDP-sugar epimerase